MPWNLTADLIETCSCNVLCPCWFGVKELMKMDQGWCASALTFRIRDGRANRVDLKDRTIVVGLDFPGPTLFDGNATGRVYIDDGANADQRRELEAIFQGKVGGPWEVIGGLVTTWLPTEYPKITVQEDGDTLTATVGRFGTVRSARLKDEAGRPMTLKNAGMASAISLLEIDVAPSESTWTDPDLPRRFETRSGARGTLSWSVS